MQKGLSKQKGQRVCTSWLFCWAFVATRSHCSFLKPSHILGISPFIITGNCHCDKVHYSIYKKHWLIKVPVSLSGALHIFLISEGSFFLSPSHDHVLAISSSAENSNPNWFQHNFCAQCHLSKLKYHLHLNKSLGCHLVRLTTCEAVMLLYLLYLTGKKGKLTFWKTACAAEQNFCCQAMLTDDREADRSQTCSSRQACQPQRPPSPVVLSQAAGSNWCLRGWWRKHTTERWCLC